MAAGRAGLAAKRQLYTEVVRLRTALEAVWPLVRGLHETGHPTAYLDNQPSAGAAIARIYTIVKKARKPC